MLTYLVQNIDTQKFYLYKSEGYPVIGGVILYGKARMKVIQCIDVLP
jgi:hypothetical protein